MRGVWSSGAGTFLRRQVRERNSRLSLESCEERFQFAMLLGGNSIQRCHFRVEFEIDGFVLNFVGALVVGPVAVGGVPMTGALWIATLHHSFEHGPLAKVVELHELLFEGFETLLILSNESGQFGVRGFSHMSYGI